MSSAFLTSAGECLLFVSVLGAVMFTVGLFAARLLRAGAATHRAAVWWIALVSIVAVPLVRCVRGDFGNREPLPIFLEAFDSPEVVADGFAAIVDDPTDASSIIALETRQTPFSTEEEVVRIGPTGTLRTSDSDSDAVESRVEILEDTSRTSIAAPSPPSDARWLAGLLAVWAIGAVLGLFCLVMGVKRLSRIRVMSRAGSPSLKRRFLQCRRWIGARRVADVRVGEGVRSPFLIGGLRATVIVPAELATALRDDDLDAVLLHELAHAARGDDWSRLIEQVIVALLWFHPAVWFAARRLDEEREMACDDIAAGVVGSRRSFAKSLVRACEAAVAVSSQTISVAPAAFRDHGIGGRVRRLIRQPASTCPRFLRYPAIALVFGAATAALATPAWTEDQVSLTTFPFQQMCSLDEAWMEEDWQARFSARYTLREGSGQPFGRILLEEVRPGARTRIEGVAMERGPVRWVVRINDLATEWEVASRLGQEAIDRVSAGLDPEAEADLKRSLSQFGWE